MTQQYRVVISGRTISGGPLAEIRAEVGRAFRLQGEQLDRMLSGGPMVVSRSCSLDAAKKLHGRLLALDLEARIEAVATNPSPPAGSPAKPEARQEPAKSGGAEELFALAGPNVVPVAASMAAGGEALAPDPTPAAVAIDVVCPKCGEAQPKRTLCRKCGLDMPRFLAAQEAAEREAREERAAEQEARRQSRGAAPGDLGERQAGVLGIGFSGRLGRLDYFAGSLFSSTIWLLLVLLAVSTGKMAFAGLGLFLSVIYGVRCIVLRLHDTGRTGWLALVVLVPLLGALMAFALLFIGGDQDDNEHGPVPPEGGGRRALLVLVSLFVVAGLSYRSIGQHPEKALRFLEAMNAGQGAAMAGGDDGAAAGAPGAVRYASSNRIDIYVMAGCGACDEMRAWFTANGLPYTVYAVDSDQRAAERLRSILAGDGQGRIMLPVVEINGKVLPGNPGVGNLHRYLRQESS